ncbi:MAG: FHA domain-containing protein [Planctomycetes bacterium]|nr:FHA domain-containing protein [Planctomycetota bacterium]
MKLFVEENGEVRQLDFEGPVVQIGREKDNQVVIHDPRSSRHHCRVLHTPDGFFVEDLQSRNGTLLNGARITRSSLQEGDVIQIGKTRIGFDKDPLLAAPLKEEAARGGARTSAVRTRTVSATPAPAAGVKGLDEASVLESPEPETLAVAPAAAEARKPAVMTTGEAYLEGIAGGHAGKKIPITRVPYTIGRLVDNNLRIEDAKASAHHARIVRRENVFYIEDLDSKNGTLVNGKRIRECPLVPGMRLHIGESQYRVQVPQVEGVDLEPFLGPAHGAAGGEVVAEDGFSHFNVQEFLKEADRSGQPILAAGILLVLGTILYFTIDITLKLIEKKNPDPSPEGNNLLVNWSFEDEAKEPGKIPGWMLLDPDSGSFQITQELSAGVKHPGFKALKVSASPPAASDRGLVRAAYFQNMPIISGLPYHLYGHVFNNDAFGAGLMVIWLKTTSLDALAAPALAGSSRSAEVGGGSRAEERSGLTEVGRQFTHAVRSEGEEEDMVLEVVPPGSAQYAQVACFVLTAAGKAGSASFDQIYFSKNPPPWIEKEIEAAAPGEGEDKAAGEPEAAAAVQFPIALSMAPPADQGKPGKRDQPILAELISEGAIANLRRGRAPQLQALWPGLPLEDDALLLGPRLATESSPAKRGAVVRLRSQVPDLSHGEWYPVETQIIQGSSELVCRYRFQPPLNSKSEKAPERVALYFEIGGAKADWSAMGESGSVEINAGSASPSPVVELVLGQGEEQIVCQFNPPLHFQLLPATISGGVTGTLTGAVNVTGAVTVTGTGGRGRAVLVGSASPPGEKARDLEVALARYSREEDKAVKELLERAAKVYLAGKPGEATAILDELVRRFPWRTEAIQQAKGIRIEWSKAAQVALGEITSDFDNILKKTPSLSIYQNLLARGKSLLERHQGTGDAESIAALLGRMQAFWSDLEKDSVKRLSGSLYEKGSEYFKEGKISLAELVLKEVKRIGADADTLQNVGRMLALIQKRKEGKASLSGQ